MIHLRSLLMPAIASLLAGCAGTIPQGYVKVDDHEYRFRAVSADGSAMGLRIEENPENGDLTFWDKAIQRQMVEIKGYRLAARREIKSRSGRDGVEFMFEYRRDGADFTYLVSLFVQGREIRIFEAAGVRDKLATDLPEIRKSIQTWPGL